MSLYTELMTGANKEYDVQTSALNRNAAAISSFGQFAARYELVPHVKCLDSGNVNFVAQCPRGKDPQKILGQLEAAGLTIGEFSKPALQFNDGYVMWTTPISNQSTTFQFLFYVPLEVA